MKAANLEFNGKAFKRFYVTDLDEMVKCCHLLLDSKATRLGLDIETSKKIKFLNFVPVKKGNRTIGPAPGLCPLLSDIRLIQIFDPIQNAVYVFDAMKIPLWRNSCLFRSFLTERKFIAHNGVFEIKHFTHNSYPNMHIDCSMLLTILVDRAERSPFEPEEEDEDEPADGMAKYKKTGYGLDAVIGRLYGCRVEKAFQTSDWNRLELSKDQINYAALDAVLTYRVGRDMMEKVLEYKMLKAYTVLRDMQHVVADMELTGIAIDKKQHNSLIKEWEKQHAENTIECTKRFKKVNLNSSKQLNAWAKEKYPEAFWCRYWPKTKASTEENQILSFGKDTLKEVIDTIERRFKQRSNALLALLEYKKFGKLLSTYGETLAAITHPSTGRVHCSFIIGETRTGRLSSREPNLQNLPRDKSVRRLFIAPDAKHLLVADYSQIEIRTAAALSKDPVMTNAFIKGIDLHKYIVKMCFGWKMKDITKEQRQMGKAINFGYEFRMGWKKFARYALTSYGVKITDEQAKHTFDTYHSLYRVYSAWCEAEYRKCERLGFVRTPLGKIRKLLPEEQYTRSVNTQVQGGAAEAIMLALIYFRKEMPKGCKLISTIHDEIIVECDQQKPEYKDLLEKCMVKGFQDVFPEAPICGLVEASYGRTWADAKQ